MTLERLAGALTAGLLFGSGLMLSGMTNPANILAFLDVAGDWNPALALVMGSAVLTAAPAYAWTRHHGRTLLHEPVALKNSRPLDAPLLLGAAVFGAGWGISGLCPGPALLLAAHGRLSALFFITAMMSGMLTVLYFHRHRVREDG